MNHQQWRDAFVQQVLNPSRVRHHAMQIREDILHRDAPEYAHQINRAYRAGAIRSHQLEGVLAVGMKRHFSADC